MKIKLDSDELESILFKNERIEKLIECIHDLIEEDVVEICGTSENCFNYILYDVLDGIRKNNKRLDTIMTEAVRIKEQPKEGRTMEERGNSSSEMMEDDDYDMDDVKIEMKLSDIMDKYNCDRDVAESMWLCDEEEDYEN